MRGMQACLWLASLIYLFFFPLAVVIECCQWKDGSCKSVPPILMGLDVWYSVFFFSFVLVFFQICWWILFSWICCIKKKKGVVLSIFAGCRRSDLWKCRRRRDTCVCSRWKLFPFSCLQNFFCFSSGFSLTELALCFRFALRSTKSYKGRWLTGSLLSHGPNVPPGLFMT